MEEWVNRFSFTGRRALVKEATKGIDFEDFKVPAGAGADIVAVGRDEKGSTDVVRAVTALGRRCVPIAASCAYRQ